MMSNHSFADFAANASTTLHLTFSDVCKQTQVMVVGACIGGTRWSRVNCDQGLHLVGISFLFLVPAKTTILVINRDPEIPIVLFLAAGKVSVRVHN